MHAPADLKVAKPERESFKMAQRMIKFSAQTLPPPGSNIADVSNSVLDLFGVLAIEGHSPQTIAGHMTCLRGKGR